MNKECVAEILRSEGEVSNFLDIAIMLKCFSFKE
jgi:hypothetical protein